MTVVSARQFVLGKLFAFNCFDGSRGAGRIYTDGSVIGNIQFRGNGAIRYVMLPSGDHPDRGRIGLRSPCKGCRSNPASISTRPTR